MIDVAVIGATGVVGQKIISLLQNNKKFVVSEVVASEKRVGGCFADACDWREPMMEMPEKIAKMKFVGVGGIKSKFVLSCLPHLVAETVEPFLVESGKVVFSNASTFRMEKNVPLIVPEINYDHLMLVNGQNESGKIITNPNCSAVGVSLSLAPLLELCAIRHVSVVTMQSVSGAGYPGVPSLDAIGNTVPHIADEANKITEETKKILGSIDAPLNIAITTNVHRVPVLYGHVATMHVTFEKDVLVDDVFFLYDKWNKKHKDLYVFHKKLGRPQSALDLKHDDMRVHLGHIYYGDRRNIIGLVALTHNLVRGAAGAVISNMESYLNFFEKTISFSI